MFEYFVSFGYRNFNSLFLASLLNGDGQFLNSSGILIREKSKIVILIYENRPEKERVIEKMIKTYKRTFQQESVLRITSQVQVSL
ncbi:DUF3574 domain-containing protein [Tychonema sp. BBK16]|uniref:DUF3574 domain-containing protein n=1 Tax=Tychonema sp. BBK16 TaxID=2699888 RepID=UPI0038D2AE62